MMLTASYHFIQKKEQRIVIKIVSTCDTRIINSYNLRCNENSKQIDLDKIILSVPKTFYVSICLFGLRIFAAWQ